MKDTGWCLYAAVFCAVLVVCSEFAGMPHFALGVAVGGVVYAASHWLLRGGEA